VRKAGSWPGDVGNTGNPWTWENRWFPAKSYAETKEKPIPTVDGPAIHPNHQLKTVVFPSHH